MPSQGSASTTTLRGKRKLLLDSASSEDETRPGVPSDLLTEPRERQESSLLVSNSRNAPYSPASPTASHPAGPPILGSITRSFSSMSLSRRPKAARRHLSTASTPSHHQGGKEALDGSPVGIDYLPPRPRSPTLSEMDAFFGFVPEPASASSPPPISKKRRNLAPDSSSSTIGRTGYNKRRRHLCNESSSQEENQAAEYTESPGRPIPGQRKSTRLSIPSSSREQLQSASTVRSPQPPSRTRRKLPLSDLSSGSEDQDAAINKWLACGKLTESRRHLLFASEDTESDTESEASPPVPLLISKSRRQLVTSEIESDEEDQEEESPSTYVQRKRVIPLQSDDDEEDAEGEENEQNVLGPSDDDEKSAPARKMRQLEAIPVRDMGDDDEVSKDARQSKIIEALENLALSILTRLVHVVVNVPEAKTTGSSSFSAPILPVSAIVVQLVNRKGVGVDASSALAASKTKKIKFPRRLDVEEGCNASSLAVLLKTIELILDGLRNGQTATLRDLYYRAVKVFGKQARVDEMVNDIAATLAVSRDELNVVAAAKGLFAGRLTLSCSDGSTVIGGEQGALIPPMKMVTEIDCEDACWILVIEKEGLTTFDFTGNGYGEGILITGKGYPDVATRELLKRLAELLPEVPILCLVDSDPHGLEILSTYKYGSAALAFDSARLAVDRIEWIGVKGTQWDELGVGRDALLPLTNGDRKKALKMLSREWLPEEWKRELQYMLHLQRKAEIQVLPRHGLVDNPEHSTLYSFVTDHLKAATSAI